MMLSELGFGWCPAFVDDREELQFIAEQSRSLLETYDWHVYLIGGLGYASLEAHGYSKGKSLKKVRLGERQEGFTLSYDKTICNLFQKPRVALF